MALYQKIILPTRPQPDTIVGIFLLKTFAQEKYPGIENATIEVLATLSPEETESSCAQKGILLIDIGGGAFDHHSKNTTVSRLIAEYLGISQMPGITKLLSYAERDDKYGMGTISKDPLDKAFGLSGLIAAINKTLPQRPNDVVEYILPLLGCHYLEERKRTEELPMEFDKALSAGRAKQLQAKHKGKNITVVLIESDDHSMAGWLRSTAGVRADVVAQKTSAGYVNILTRPLKKVDLRGLAYILRKQELMAHAITSLPNPEILMKPGRISEVPNWYYDRATNSILNGGTNPQGVSHTAIPWKDFEYLLIQGLQLDSNSSYQP